MSYQARRNDGSDPELRKERSDQNNANNIRNAADVAIASGEPHAAAVGAVVKAGDKLTDGKVSDELGKALTKVNQIAPGGRRIQDTLDDLNESGLSDKVGQAAFIYNNMNNNPSTQEKTTATPDNKKQPQPLEEENPEQAADGKASGSLIKKVAIAFAISLLPILLLFVIIISVVITVTHFEDGVGAAFESGEGVGGFVEVDEVSKDAKKFYERINEVKLELAEEGMFFESTKIVAVYFVMSNENNNITYKKMTKSKIKDIAKLMFKEEKDSEGNIIYTYDEELFKENLKEKFYKKYFLLYSDKRREEMAQDTIDYINDYYAYIGENPSNSGSASTGPYIGWKQYEGPWTNVQLGTSGKTIKEIGCAATSVSMLIAKSGVPTTVPLNPGTFVTTLNGVGGFGSGSCRGCINWGAASSVAPSFRFSGNIDVSGQSKNQKLNTLSNLLNQGYYVTAEVKGNTGEHWIAIDTIQGSNIIMMDPGSTQKNLWLTYPWQNTSRYVYYKVV